MLAFPGGELIIPGLGLCRAPTLRGPGRSEQITRDREIYTMGADGAGVVQLTFTDDVYNWFPFWSPDSTRITFSSNREGSKYQIYVMGSDGSNPVPMARGCISAYSPDGARIVYSSFCDGTRIVFQSKRDGATNLYAIRRKQPSGPHHRRGLEGRASLAAVAGKTRPSDSTPLTLRWVSMHPSLIDCQ